MSKAEETVFFVDENLLGRRIPKVLRNAGVRVELLSDHFPLQTPDVEWLAEVSQRGWFVITRDMKIGINVAEVAAVARGNAKVFALSGGSAPGAEIERDVKRAVEKMKRFAYSHPAPFIARVDAYGKVKKWLDREKLLRLLKRYELNLEE